jgi:hypothetical protein
VLGLYKWIVKQGIAGAGKAEGDCEQENSTCTCTVQWLAISGVVQVQCRDVEHHVHVVPDASLTFGFGVTQRVKVVQHGLLERTPLAPVFGVVRVGKGTAGRHDDDATVCCRTTVRVLELWLQWRDVWLRGGKEFGSCAGSRTASTKYILQAVIRLTLAPFTTKANSSPFYLGRCNIHSAV